MSDITREPPWMCVGCGYVMDSAAPYEGTGVPEESDATLCMNCAAVHIRHGTRWLPITPAERDSLSLEEAENLARAARHLRRVIDVDLARRQGGGRA